MIVGGAQENTLLSIIGHIQKGHEVTLLTGPSPGPEGKLLKKSEIPELKIITISHLLRNISPINDLSAYFELKKIFINNKFDVVHTHSSKAGIIGRAAAWKAEVPFIVHTVHGQAFHPYQSKWKNKIYILLEKWAAKRCHKIYSVAEAMIKQCVDAGVAPGSKYKKVYSGMKLEPFLKSEKNHKLQKKLKIPENKRIIGTVARLFPLKGYEFFIPAAKKLLKKYDDIHFLIVGDGILTDKIKNNLENDGLLENFSFTGLVPPDKVYKYISTMDILVHLSLREGLPRTVVQALASAKPAVGFRLDGTPEVLIDGETGFAVEAEKTDKAVEKIKFLLDNPSKAQQMGQKGRQFIKERFDWRKMSEILEQEYINGLKKQEKT